MTPLNELKTIEECEDELTFLTDEMVDIHEHCDQVNAKLKRLQKQQVSRIT